MRTTPAGDCALPVTVGDSCGHRGPMRTVGNFAITYSNHHRDAPTSEESGEDRPFGQGAQGPDGPIEDDTLRQ